MENEIMNGVEEVMENNEVVTTSGTGIGMLIGAGLLAAGYGAAKLAKKGIEWYKTKKNANVIEIDNTGNDESENVED